MFKELAKAIYLAASFKDAQWGDNWFDGGRADWAEHLSHGSIQDWTDYVIAFRLIARA